MVSTAFRVKRNQRQPRPLYHALILLGIGCVLILFVLIVQPFFSLNLWLSDMLFISEPPSPNIVVVGIDDDALNTYGRWEAWPRSLHAQAINNLSEAGARVIAFDVLFSESTPYDETLAAAMKESGNIVLPLAATEPQPSANHEVTFTHIILPTPSLQVVSDTGHGNVLIDNDGKVRRLPLIIHDSGGLTYPAFSLVVLHKLFSAPLPQQYLRENGAIHLLNRDIPVDSSYCLRINFAPEDSKRPYVSYKDIVSGEFDPEIVANKTVLIGMVATGEYDKWEVPRSPGKVSGVFVQADIIDNILRQQFVTEVGTGTNLVILLLMTAISGFALPRFGLRWGGAFAGVLFIGYLAASSFAFEKGYVLNILYPLLMLPIMYTGSSLTQNVVFTIENTRLNRRVLDGYKSTIRALVAAIDAKDHYTHGHSQRVTELALAAAKTLNMSQEELEILEYAGILHDIGKIGIPDNILGKPGRLTPEEFDIIRQHPRWGANIITDIPFLERARKIVLHHHEKYDGSGYPDGLVGDKIPLSARLLAVSDAFDSMTSDRAYRAAMSTEDAIRELQKHQGTQFCPIAVKAFISGFKTYFDKPTPRRP